MANTCFGDALEQVEDPSRGVYNNSNHSEAIKVIEDTGDIDSSSESATGTTNNNPISDKKRLSNVNDEILEVSVKEPCITQTEKLLENPTDNKVIF